MNQDDNIKRNNGEDNNVDIININSFQYPSTGPDGKNSEDVVSVTHEDENGIIEGRNIDFPNSENTNFVSQPKAPITSDVDFKYPHEELKEKEYQTTEEGNLNMRKGFFQRMKEFFSKLFKGKRK